MRLSVAEEGLSPNRIKRSESSSGGPPPGRGPETNPYGMALRLEGI